MRSLGSSLILLSAVAVGLPACESSDPTPTAETVAPPTAVPTAAPSTTASAVPTASSPPPKPAAAPSAEPTVAPEAPTTLLGKLALAERVKLRRPLGAGEETTVDDPTKLKALRDAIGMDQEPSDGCPRCLPSVQLVFEDATKTRLGSVGLFCDASEASEVAVLRDALAESCQSLKLADAERLRELVDEALPMAKEP